MMKIVFLPLFVCVLAFACSRTTQDPGLVVHATFDTDARDSGPNQFHGELKGAVIEKESVVGTGAVYMDGVDDYVEFPSGEVYFNGDYSIGIWCKFQSARVWSRILDFNQDRPSSGNSVTWLIGRPGNTENNMWFDQWVIYDSVAVESILNIRESDPANAYLMYDVIPDEWAHYVVTYDSGHENSLGMQVNTKGEQVPLEGLVTLYVNGTKISTSEYCLRPRNIPTVANWLGRSRFDPDPYYHGYMDDFRVYNRVLTPEEISDLYELKNN